MSAIFWMQI